jgi:hypothetical protein
MQAPIQLIISPVMWLYEVPFEYMKFLFLVVIHVVIHCSVWMRKCQCHVNNCCYHVSKWSRPFTFHVS